MIDGQEDGSAKGPQKPFHTLDMSNDDEVLAWLNLELDHLKQQAQERHMNQRKNLCAFRGIQYSSTARSTRDREESASESTINRRTKNPRVVYNHMVDMVEQDVARMTKYRGAIACTPPSDDNSDRVTAQVVEKLIEGFWAKPNVNIDKLMARHSRRKRIFGEDFFWVTWNPNLGPYHPEWIAQVFKANGIQGDPLTMRPGDIAKAFRTQVKKIPKVPLLDDDGKHVEKDGQPAFIDKPVRMGDVEYQLWFSWDMFLQRKAEEAQVEYGFGRERMKVDTARAQAPKVADKITPDPNYNFYDADTCEELARNDEVEVIHFYHRSTDEIDGGRYVKFTRGAIMRNTENPVKGEDNLAIFPWHRTPDIETPAVLNGDATVTHGRGPQMVYNNLVSLKVRNRFQFSHPKWFAPANSIKVEKLTNNTTVAFYKGPVPPTLSQPAINEANESQMMQEAKGDMQQIMGVFGISRGDPPAGVVANVALTFLDEQESDRANVSVQNHTDALRQVAVRTAWLMSDYYEDQDGRLEKLLGKNLAAQIKDFKMSDLRSMGDLNIRNMTAMPQQKSARMQWIVDMRKEFPMLITDDVAADALGLGDVEKLRNSITVAIRKAESETGSMMNGAAVPAPLEVEYQLAHYRVHMRQMNEISFEKLPEDQQQHFVDHVMATEMHLAKICQRVPGYIQLIQKDFPGFPYFFVPEELGAPPPDAAMPPEAGMMPPAMAGGAPMPGAQEGMPLPPGAEAQAMPPEAMAPGAGVSMPPQGAM
jgi:hypothetical protein